MPMIWMRLNNMAQKPEYNAPKIKLVLAFSGLMMKHRIHFILTLHWLPLGAPVVGAGENYTPSIPVYVEGHAI